MGSDRNPPIPSPRAEVEDRVGHDRVGSSLALTMRAGGGEAEVVEGGRGQRVSTVAVFFFETPRPPLNAAASADIEAAVEIRRHVSTRGGKAATGGPGERGARYVARVTCQGRPPALGPDVRTPRRPCRPPPRLRLRLHVRLRVRLRAAEHHSERDSGAQQTAICHPLPPAANTRVTMVVPPPLPDLRHPA